MLIPTSKAEYAALAAGDPYYRGRWPYVSEALEMVASLGPIERALEIGPGPCGKPLLWGAETMDIVGNPTYLQDAGTPWPIADKAFDVVIALQVWEHLQGRQQEAWREVARCTRAAVLSFPLYWDAPGDLMHHGITWEKIDHWTCGESPRSYQVIGRHPRKRAVCLYLLP